MSTFDSIDDIRTFMLSQPFDKELSSYKSSLYPADKLLYEQGVGPCYNYILDWQTGKYEHLSESFEELMGYGEEFADRGIEATIEIIHPNDREAFHKIISKFWEILPRDSEEAFNQHSVNYNFRLKKRSGGYVNLLQQPIYATLDREGNVVYDAGMLMDITRYRTDGNLSLLIIGPDGEQILEYYPKEDFAPRIAAVRDTLAELGRLAGETGNSVLKNVQKVLAAHSKREELNVTMFSDKLGMSRSQLYRNVKHNIGITPNRLIRLYRLQQSLEYLAQNKLQISEIAYRVGFSSPSYFSQCFHEEFECSPSDYQKQVQ